MTDREYHVSDLTLSGDASRSPFDRIRHIREDGSEYWSAREIGSNMDYARWENMREAVDRARAAARNAGVGPDEVFRAVTNNPSGQGGRPMEDVHVTRYGAYLIAMNGDPRKPEVAKAQAYFAIQTRKAETAAPAKMLTEMSRREILTLALEAEDRADAERERAEVAEAHAETLAPAADSWHDLASGIGDQSVREAAQILSRAGVEIGQRRLFGLIRDLGWIDSTSQPYQRFLAQGLISTRLNKWTDATTGKSYVTTQVRVTVKGIERLRTIILSGDRA